MNKQDAVSTKDDGGGVEGTAMGESSGFLVIVVVVL
jgi:hypothetical protein